MIFKYNDKEYEIVIIKKNNKNTYIRVKEDLKIYVTTNYFSNSIFINKLIKENSLSIEKMIDRIEVKNKKNETMHILGNEVDVIRLSNQKEPELYGNKFYIKNDLEKSLKKYAFVIFEERLNIIYNLFNENIPYPILKIRKMTTRWGVCNRKDKSVTLNLELIKMDYKYIDYVIVHELSHFVHFDHSKEFWNTVSKYCPQYKKIRKEMRD